MFRYSELLTCPLAASVMAVGLLGGCSHCERCQYMGDITPKPIGMLSDPIWQAQEQNAEAADFIVYEHEWAGNSAMLNQDGKEHINQIAARANMHRFPIVIEPATKSPRDDTQYFYPVHGDKELDARRRAMMVEALQLLGVPDADERVVVATSYSPGFYGFEGQKAFSEGFSGRGGVGGSGGGGGGRF